MRKHSSVSEIPPQEKLIYHVKDPDTLLTKVCPNGSNCPQWLPICNSEPNISKMIKLKQSNDIPLFISPNLPKSYLFQFGSSSWINSSSPSDANTCQWLRTSLDEVVACSALRHYLEKTEFFYPYGHISANLIDSKCSYKDVHLKCEIHCLGFILPYTKHQRSNYMLRITRPDRDSWT